MKKKMEEAKQDIQTCLIPRWQLLKATLNNLEFESFVRKATTHPNASILDVRTPEEFATGSLEGAINLDYLSLDLADELEALPKEKTYFVLCRTSRRSIRICVILQNAGFPNVYNLDTGLQHRTFE
jgi:rhodanese-related sulfurtransferase